MIVHNRLRSLWKSLVGEVRSNPLAYLFLSVILVVALFVRVYRTQDLLRFYYDQGRDALVIWKLWHEGKFFLVGPITGLKGIFLGPFYYYLIAPIYLLGRGNPVYPAVFLGFLSTCAIFVVYILGRKMHSVRAGLFAALISSFSYYIFTHSRWLSNPNPILLSSVILLWSLWEISSRSSKYWWIVASLAVGFSLHFESASAVFYIPLMFVFSIWKWRRLPGLKVTFISGLLFLLTLLPQIAFNFRHDNILFNNFRALFFEEKAFQTTTKFILEVRSEYFWSVFSTKLFPGWNTWAGVFMILAGTVLLVSNYEHKRKILSIFGIFLITPIVGYLLFQGNHGNIYDYYMSGYYLPFVLLFAIGIAELWERPIGALVVLFFFYLFFSLNGSLVKNYIFATPENRPIAMEDQLKAISWVFEDSKSRGNFNVDVYVPPVIPYAYDYLFLWRATRECGEDLCGMVEERVDLLYTLYEDDPPHPERLEAWMDRQEGIGIVEEEASFGAITVQRRKRL